MNKTIYVLKLQHNKYYIGKTTNIQRRFDEHMNSNGAEWTRIFRPIEIIKTFSVEDELSGLFEDLITKKFMIEYGIDNVRGGSYCAVEFSEEISKFIRKELWHAQNLCLNCGQRHSSKNCNVHRLWTPPTKILHKKTSTDK